MVGAFARLTVLPGRCGWWIVQCLVLYPPRYPQQCTLRTAACTLSEGFEPVRKKPQLGFDTESSGLSTSSPSSEGSQKPPFGCGCGKCTLFSFIQKGCSNPISSENSFPYLDISGLTDKEEEDLRERLRFESKEIMLQFQKLVSSTMESLISRNISLQRLVAHIMKLEAFDPVFKEPQVPLFQDRLKGLKTAYSISEIFLILGDYFSFFNYDIIEHIIEVLGTEKDKDKLQCYKDEFYKYAKRRIFECGPIFGPESETDLPNIFVKLDSRYDNYTVAEIKGFCRKLSKTLHLSSDGVLRLCRVEKGCIQLTFQVPSFVQQEIFPLSREQEMVLTADGVKLTLENDQLSDSADEQHDMDASGRLCTWPMVISVKGCQHVSFCVCVCTSPLQLTKWSILSQCRRKLMLTQHLMVGASLTCSIHSETVKGSEPW